MTHTCWYKANNTVWLGLADRAWETDDNGSLMLCTQITHKNNPDSWMPRHLSLFSYSSILSYLQCGDFSLCNHWFLWWQRQMERLRGKWPNQLKKRGNIPLCFYINLRLDMNSYRWSFASLPLSLLSKSIQSLLCLSHQIKYRKGLWLCLM